MYTALDVLIVVYILLFGSLFVIIFPAIVMRWKNCFQKVGDLGCRRVRITVVNSNAKEINACCSVSGIYLHIEIFVNIKKTTKAELGCIIAHEIGHYKNGDLGVLEETFFYKRSLKREQQADLFACGITGTNEYVKMLTATTVVSEEINARIAFIKRKDVKKNKKMIRVVKALVDQISKS